MHLILKPSALFLTIILFFMLSTSSLYAANKYSLSAHVGQQVTSAFELYKSGKIDQTLAR